MPPTAAGSDGDGFYVVLYFPPELVTGLTTGKIELYGLLSQNPTVIYLRGAHNSYSLAELRTIGTSAQFLSVKLPCLSMYDSLLDTNR